MVGRSSSRHRQLLFSLIFIHPRFTASSSNASINGASRMPLMEWNDKLSVGVTQFDNEHKKLVSLMNDLFDAVQAGRGKEALGRILDDLVSYTKTHFINEEQYMQKHGYDSFLAHQQEHEALTKRVIEVQQKYHSGATAMLSMEVMTFLKNWLVKHIQGTDKKYGPFLNGKGVR
ncbi:hypothetical protein CCP2SC5_100058 [Azospirillaceae bacterium]